MEATTSFSYCGSVFFFFFNLDKKASKSSTKVSAMSCSVLCSHSMYVYMQYVYILRICLNRELYDAFAVDCILISVSINSVFLALNRSERYGHVILTTSEVRAFNMKLKQKHQLKMFVLQKVNKVQFIFFLSLLNVLVHQATTNKKTWNHPS